MRRVVGGWVVGWLLQALLATGGVEASALATIEGRVRDQEGREVARATVTVENHETGAVRAVRSNAAGFYLVAALGAGAYDVTAARVGAGSLTLQGVGLRVGQTLALDLTLPAAGEARSLPAVRPAVPAAGPGVVALLSREWLEMLPSSNRVLADLVTLAPTVQPGAVPGFPLLGGQRAAHSGLEIDGVDAKSGFFGTSRGGEAVANHGLAVGLSSIGDLRAVASGVAPEHGSSAGVYLDLVTRRGGNRLEGSAFSRTRDEGPSTALPSPLAEFLGRQDAPAVELQRNAYGVAAGGPVRRDRTHLFFSWDHVDRVERDRRALGRGTYDALRARILTDFRFLGLLAGWQPNADGVAAADAENGRTARMDFYRRIENELFVARLDHRFGDSQSASLRLGSGDFELASGNQDEESLTFESTSSLLARLVSVVGTSGINEASLEIASNDLDRRSVRSGQFIEAEIVLGPNRDVVGKAGFLPIRTEEARLQLRDGFSFSIGNHSLKGGVDYRRDDVEHLDAPLADARYFFDSLEDFIRDQASRAEIFFGDPTFPNHEATRESYGLYIQDRWKPVERLSILYGLRFGGTVNPGGFEHLFPEGRDIPDDSGNLAPRLGFTWTPDGGGRSVVRGGLGLFFSRPPGLLFAGTSRDNGLFPNAGPVSVTPSEVGFVALGEEIDSQGPPPEAALPVGFVDPGYEDAETLRLNLGYEREVAPGWTAAVDLLWAESDNLLENVDLNRTVSLDEFGRPVFSPLRPLTRGQVTGEADDTPLGEVLARRSIGESEYRAVVLRLDKRFSDTFGLRAHYTWAEDRDTSSHQGEAGAVTLLRPDSPRFDFGSSDREIESRLVVSGLVTLPLDLTLSGIYEYRGGRPWNPVDRAADSANCGFAALGANCPDIRPVVDGAVVARNSFRNESFSHLDLRLGKFFQFRRRFRTDLFLEVFNVFDEAAFEVDAGSRGDSQRDPESEEFALASRRILDPRRIQIGARFAF